MSAGITPPVINVGNDCEEISVSSGGVLTVKSGTNVRTFSPAKWVEARGVIIEEKKPAKPER
jgi:hypothetical protein